MNQSINQTKNKEYNTVGTILKSNIKIVERGNIDTPNTQLHDSSLSWLGTGTSIKSGGVKRVLWTQTSSISEMMRSWKCFPYVSNMQALAYNLLNSVIIKNAIILNFMHNIFNLRDTGVHWTTYFCYNHLYEANYDWKMYMKEKIRFQKIAKMTVTDHNCFERWP